MFISHRFIKTWRQRGRFYEINEDKVLGKNAWVME